MDYPYQFVPDEVRVTDELEISEEERALLYQRNAEQLFKLKYGAEPEGVRAPSPNR
jgi:2,3-dihydroxybenzoate decarboxylase